MADLVVRGRELRALAERVRGCGRTLSVLTTSLLPLGDPVLDDAAATCAGTILATVDGVGDALGGRARAARTADAAYRHTDAVLAQRANTQQVNTSVRGTRVCAE
jgi:hypothetical protein